MQLFLITKSKNKSLSLSVGPISLCVSLILLVIVGLLIFQLGANHMMQSTRGSFKTLYDQTAPIWSKEIEVQQKTLNELQMTTENSLDALATKLSILQARVMRLDALGSRLADFVEFSDIDFDISKALANFTKLPQELISFEVNNPHKVIMNSEVRSEVSKLEKKLGNKGRVLIRPSGTEDLLRVMVEASSKALAEDLAKELSDFIRKAA